LLNRAGSERVVMVEAPGESAIRVQMPARSIATVVQRGE
jgi:hypothetical protein